jgi:hypothetical protein
MTATTLGARVDRKRVLERSYVHYHRFLRPADHAIV